MSSMLAFIDALATRGRVRGYCILLLLAYTVAAAVYLMTSHAGVDWLGRPLGTDFIIFYSASKLALQGAAAAAHDPAQLVAVHRTITDAPQNLYLWVYPPSFLLMVLPLGLLPYPFAWAAWTTAGLALYLLLIRRISRRPEALLAALAFPGAFMNLMQGQNGFLSAGLLGFGLLQLDRRPWLGGALLGLLAYKPQLAALPLLLLLATGRWRALGGAVLSGAALALASLLLFGIEAWTRFLTTLPMVSENLASGALDWAKIPTVFIGLRSLGAPQGLAYACHAAVALGVLAVTLRAWRASGPLELKAALATTAALIVTPYTFDYDLAILAIPIGVCADRIARTGQAPAGVRTALALGFLTPVLFQGVAKLLDVQVGAVGLLALFAAVRTLLKPAGEPELWAEARPSPSPG